MTILKYIDDQLDFHQFRWWNNIKNNFPSKVLLDFTATYDDVDVLIEEIKNEDENIIDKIQNIFSLHIEYMKNIEAAEQHEVLAWSNLVGNSGIFKCDVPKRKKS